MDIVRKVAKALLVRSHKHRYDPLFLNKKDFEAFWKAMEPLHRKIYGLPVCAFSPYMNIMYHGVAVCYKPRTRSL